MPSAVSLAGIADESPASLDEKELFALAEFFDLLARFDAEDRAVAPEAASSATAVGEATPGANQGVGNGAE